MTAKSDLRKDARARRATLATTHRDASAAIARCASAIGLREGATVGGYWPIRDEADPRPLMDALAARGHALALGCVEEPDAPLVFRAWREDDPMRPNAFGALEPLPDAELRRPDAILVPLLAFDAQGHRLGYGGGYYDRTLAALRETGSLLAIGIAYAGQEIGAFPRQPHDQRLDMVVTEQGIRRFG
jgi:5-formyltetrahydrofolate cyclo-ligase